MESASAQPLPAATAELLAGVPLFAGLSDQDLQRVAQVAVPRHFDAGTVILREGDPGDTCYILKSGRARVVREHPDGRAITLHNIGSGEIFGELAMFEGEVRSATVEAIDEVEAVAILASDLKRLLESNPEIAVKLLAALGAKLREANARIARQSFQNVSSRVAGVLVELGETGSVTLATDGQGSDITIRSTQADLAQLAGTSREATSRFLAQLQRAGVVTCKRGRVIIHDPPALRRYIY
jgi:CRP/FNR family transcriptional regulator